MYFFYQVQPKPVPSRPTFGGGGPRNAGDTPSRRQSIDAARVSRIVFGRHFIACTARMCTHLRAHRFTHTHARAHTHTLAHTRSLARSLTHSFTRSLALSRAFYPRTHTHTHTHTHTRLPPLRMRHLRKSQVRKQRRPPKRPFHSRTVLVYVTPSFCLICSAHLTRLNVRMSST